MLIAIQILFALINIGEAKFQAWWFDVKQRKIDHTVWAFQYLLLCCITFFFAHNLWLIAACLIQRLPVFNSFLNYWRIPRRPLFYINPKGDSWMDRIMGKYYPVFFWLCLAGLIALNLIMFL